MGSIQQVHDSGSPDEVDSLPLVLEKLAQDYPHKIWMRISSESGLTTRDITYQELSDAVDGMTRWVVDRLGIGTSGDDVVAYLGINDMRYAVAQIGLIKAGYVALLPSPRNSAEGQSSLFSATHCKTLLFSENCETAVETIKKFTEVQTIQIPSFDELIEPALLAKIPCPSAYSNNIDKKAIILHTSGSTGNPKPIYYTNGFVATMRNFQDLPGTKGRENSITVLSQSDSTTVVIAPFFHVMGGALLWQSLLCRRTMCCPAPGKPPTGDVVAKLLEYTKPEVLVTPPSILEELAETPGGLDSLRHPRYVSVGGGPLAEGVGERLNKITTLVNMIGSTEIGVLVSRLPEDKADWKYFEWAPEAGAVMEPDSDESGLYELTIRPADKRYHGLCHSFPGTSVWRTKDLFKEHPQKKGLWLYKGRRDDVLVLSNGEKFNPVSFEKTLESHPAVKGALVVGQGRFQTALLIEPEWSLLSKYGDLTEFIEEIWPLIERANTAAPAHARVWKSKIAISAKDKPFARAPKGSIVRRQTTKLYEEEIDVLYSDDGNADELGLLEADADVEATIAYVRKAFKITGFAIPEEAPDDASIFNYGIDSLQIMALSSTLGKATGRNISPRTIYSTPTARGLAELLIGSTNGSLPAVNGSASREETMEKMVQKYTAGLAARPSRQPTRPEKGHTVVLTGSTGSLGSHILQELISSPTVTHIFALNRSSDARSRQEATFDARGLSIDLAKVTFLTTDFSREHFGLDQNTYNTMLQSVSIFIHNAWAVDFNKPLAAFEDTHIAGTRRAVDFSLASTHNAHIIFISSIASVANWFAVNKNDTLIPEDLSTNHSVPSPQGYGESKHVSSLILAHAANHSNIPVTLVRAGQLAGSALSTAEWNRHEWLPSLVITSKALGLIPETLGNQNLIDWIPTDVAAKAVFELSLSNPMEESSSSSPLTVVNLVNPHTTSWTDELLPTVQKSIQHETGKEVKVVSYKDWVAALQASPMTPEEVGKRPSLKLLDFYSSLQAEGVRAMGFETGRVQELSETMRGLGAVDDRLMGKWLGEWQM